MLDGKRIDLATSTRGLALTGGAHHLILSAPGRRSAEESLEIPEGGAALVICENLLPVTTPPVNIGARLPTFSVFVPIPRLIVVALEVDFTFTVSLPTPLFKVVVVPALVLAIVNVLPPLPSEIFKADKPL